MSVFDFFFFKISFIALQNNSDLPAYFQFTGAGDANSDSNIPSFKFSPMSGS
jgi:hypothetical protein